MTISQWLQQAQAALGNISDASRLDAERIALHVLAQPEASWLHAHAEDELDAKQQAEFERLLAERATGKPLAYVLGEWEFYGRMFYITEDVLVPRPETESLVAEALRYIRPGMMVADIGAGSGCIAVTLAVETPTLRLIATDISPTALQVAAKNARRYGVENKITFLPGDMLTPLRGKKIDLIVSNPPYLPAEALAKAGWARETQGLKFEPRMALDGGKDGQRYINQIAASGIPAIVEGTGGNILRFNLK